MRSSLNLLREFSVPMISGVVIALIWANVAPETYHHFIHDLGPVSIHFLTNDVFMVFFFAIAAVEITQSCLPGGDLNPPRKAVNPLLATAGGVLGPVAVYWLLNRLVGSPALNNGWGIPTATDIALAWLAARLIFGNGHPLIAFLLLLAIADDAIGLVIIALFYPDPLLPVQPAWALLVAAAMGISYLLRRSRVRNYWAYLLLGGITSWIGLFKAHLHPALALVFVVPFMPHPTAERRHLFEEDPEDVSTLATFEHQWKVVVDFGMFMFGLANGGVGLSSVGAASWIVFCSLFFGKTIGVFVLGLLGVRLGFPLPEGMNRRHLLVAGMIAGIGFTVAIFVAGEAFTDPVLQGAAKMGAIMSIALFPVAAIAAAILGIRSPSRQTPPPSRRDSG